MMTIFSRKRTSSLALAIALATGSAVVATAVFPAEASAQRKKDKKEQKSDGGGYSDAFRAAYVPLETVMKDQAADVSGMTSQFLALTSVMNTADEKMAGGNLIYNAGVRAKAPELQFAGMEAMLASGLVPANALGQYNMVAFQLSSNAGDYAKARSYLQSAIDNNYTNESMGAADLKLLLAETYFSAGENQAGLAFLKGMIADRKSQGMDIPEQWYRRGVSVSYTESITPDVYEFTTMWVSDFPRKDSWTDAINITRNLNDFANGEILDLFRLSRKVNALNEASDYDYYIEAADARRLPKEVSDVISEGKAAGVIVDGNLFAAEALAEANQRIASDRAELPALERDAKAAGAGLRTVVAAGNAFLSYGQYDKAVGFFERALGMPGVETNEVLHRMGIAQIGMGDYAAARTTLGRVSGTRMPIARLWSTYADQLDSANGAAAAAEPEMAETVES